MKRRIDINKITRPTVLKLKSYQSARQEFVGSDREMILLDANENPFNTGLNRYPDPFQGKLKKRISEVKRVEVESIFLGNGSDEIINLLIVAFCEPKRDKIIIAPPTFGMYKVAADLNSVEVLEVPLLDDFQLNVPAVLEKASIQTKMIFIPTPNNPSGNCFPMRDLEQIAKGFPGLVVIDEAYIEFSPGETTIDWLGQYENIIVLQTFSKAQGLAGARVGMAFAHPDIISILNKIKAPYNLNVISQEAVFNRLNNPKQVEKEIKVILEEKELLVLKINELKFIKNVFPSATNFILIRVDDSQLRYRQLIEKGIVVRNPSKQYLCENTLRITIGTPEENKALIKALKTIDY